MTAKTRIYIVTPTNPTELPRTRLLWARTPAEARRLATRTHVTVSVASQKDLVDNRDCPVEDLGSADDDADPEEGASGDGGQAQTDASSHRHQRPQHG